MIRDAGPASFRLQPDLHQAADALKMIARVGNDPCPQRLRNEWLSPCAASTLPSFGLGICASCATRGTCIRTHLFPTTCREAAITGFGYHGCWAFAAWAYYGRAVRPWMHSSRA
jgi:hypothetical protein